MSNPSLAQTTTPSDWLADLFARLEHQAVHSAFEAMLAVDEYQRVVMINPAAERMFGCKAADVLGSSMERFVPPRLRTVHRQHFASFLHSSEPELPATMRVPLVGLRANGEEFPLEASISRVQLAHGTGQERFSTALLRDLSVQRSLEATITSLQARMRAIFELAPVAIWVTEDEQIVFANRACVALFGAADRHALIGRSIYALLAEESHATVRAQVSAVLAAPEAVVVLHERIARLDGSQREVEIALAGLPDHSRTAVQMVIADITERQRSQRELERSRSELRSLAASQVQARENERRRIARELHDELGQRLTALQMNLSALATPDRSADVQDGLREAVRLLDDTVLAMRRLAADLRPAMLDDLGLAAALEWLARDSERWLGIPVQLQLEAEGCEQLDDASATAMYRMVQEALTNVARHAKASRALVQLQRQGEHWVLSVSDNGQGMSGPPEWRDGRHGLLGMRERAHLLGGALEAGPASGGGTRVTMRLPLHPAAPRHAS